MKNEKTINELEDLGLDIENAAETIVDLLRSLALTVISLQLLFRGEAKRK